MKDDSFAAWIDHLNEENARWQEPWKGIREGRGLWDIERLEESRAMHERQEIVLAPRRMTSAAKLGSHGTYAAALTGTAILFATTPLWGLCIAAPLLIYIWWHLTRATIEAAAKLDDHPIPPARVLSEGPK